MKTNRRGFTLLEVLMAFGAGSILLGVVYFFYFGILKTTVDAGSKIDLNDVSERALMTITNDLRNTYAFTEFRPNRIVLQRLPQDAISSEEMASIGSMHLHAVEYEIVQEKDQRAKLMRREPNGVGAEAEKRVIDVDEAKLDMFTGYVYDQPTEKDDTVPRFHVFDHQTQSTGELPRITLVRVSLDFRQGKTNMQLVSKVFLPIAHNNTVHGNWNVE